MCSISVLMLANSNSSSPLYAKVRRESMIFLILSVPSKDSFILFSICSMTLYSLTSVTVCCSFVKEGSVFSLSISVCRVFIAAK